MEQINKNHIDLYRQNLGKDNISIDKLGTFKTPAIILQPKKMTVKDAELLAKTVDLRYGDYNLYIQFNGKILVPGKVYFTLDNYIKCKNSFTSARVFKVIDNAEMPNGKEVSEVTLEDMMCEITVCHKEVVEHPDVHKEFIIQHYTQYKDLIAQNYYLNTLALSPEKINEYKEQYGDKFSFNDCKLPGLFYDFINEHKDEFKNLVKF